MINRCINLDWLEVYALETSTPPERDADYFAARGWQVDVRPYGTRVFTQMFTLCDNHGLGVIEIRRKPAAEKRDGSRAFMEPYACHIRLCNRTCYFDSAALFMADFLTMHDYTFMRIKRVDIALDFERFDSGDDPARFVKRYLKGKYSKVNQANISAHGADEWEERQWNSVSWGSKKSMVSTKLYNKTQELREAKDKPYIREVWAIYNLVDNMLDMSKRKRDGTLYHPTIWRLEFSLTSSVKNWVVVEQNMNGHKQIRSLRNTLALYQSKQAMLELFASLADHYFHFKRYQPGQRKDRCQDKTLFTFDEPARFYKVEHVATSKQPPTLLARLIARLNEYRAQTYDPPMVRAIDQLLDLLRDKQVRTQLADPYSDSELQLLRSLIAYRLNLHRDEPVNDSLQVVQSLLALDANMF